MKNENEVTVETAVEAGAVARIEIPQYEMFPSLFAGDSVQGLNIRKTDNGTSVTVLKRTGKTDSLSAVSGLKGDALKAWERKQRDALKVKMNQIVSAAMASPEYTGGSMRIGKNGSLSFRLPKVEAPKQPTITSDSILEKFTSEELMELADRKSQLEMEQNEAIEASAPADETTPAVE